MTGSVAFDLARSASRRAEKYEKLIARTKEVPAIPTVVVHPCDHASLQGTVNAAKAVRRAGRVSGARQDRVRQPGRDTKLVRRRQKPRAALQT